MQPLCPEAVAFAARQYSMHLLSEQTSPLLYDHASRKQFEKNVAELGQAGIEATLKELQARKSQWKVSFERIAKQRRAQPRETTAKALATVQKGFAEVMSNLKTQMHVKSSVNAPVLLLKL